MFSTPRQTEPAGVIEDRQRFLRWLRATIVGFFCYSFVMTRRSPPERFLRQMVAAFLFKCVENQVISQKQCLTLLGVRTRWHKINGTLDRCLRKSTFQKNPPFNVGGYFRFSIFSTTLFRSNLEGRHFGPSKLQLGPSVPFILGLLVCNFSANSCRITSP